jgi:hypothetical protein
MIYGLIRGSVQPISRVLTARSMAAQPPQRDFLTRLTEPAGENLIDLIFVSDPAERWQKAIERALRPTVVVVGDDPGESLDGNGGPDAWRCANRLRRWTKGVIIHGAGAVPDHYEAVVQCALDVRRLTLIETTSLHACAWAERMACPRSLLVIPRNGLPHPLVKAEALN